MAEQTTPFLQFPSYLSGDEYKYRKFTIHVKETLALKDIAEILKKVVSSIGDYKNIDLLSLLDVGATYDKVIKKKEEIEKSLDSSKTIYSIILPLPNELNDNQAHSWNTEKGILGTFGETIEGMGNAGINVSKFLGTTANSMNMRKPMLDPGYFQNYQGSEPRTFNMSFDLIPNSPEEAGSIMGIIYLLKAFSAPKVDASGITMHAPNYFDIEIANPWISALINLKGVVISDINLSYGADGNMQCFSDGMPKYIKLELAFKERKMMTAKEYGLKL